MRYIDGSKRVGRDETMKLGKNNCIKSNNKWPCIYDLVNYVKLDRDTVKNIYRCRRCKELHTEKTKLENIECLISPTGKHSWEFSENISFRQHWKYQEIQDRQCCEYCTSTREVKYFREIGFNPHRG